MAPESGGTNPAIIFSVVVFPQPDGPSRVRNSPRATVRSMPSTAANCPKFFLTLSSRTASSSILLTRVNKVADPEEMLDSEDQDQRNDEGDGRDGSKCWRKAELKE